MIFNLVNELSKCGRLQLAISTRKKKM